MFCILEPKWATKHSLSALELLLKRFMVLLQTLTSNLKHLNLVKPAVLLPLQKSDISHTYSKNFSQNQPHSLSQSKTTAGPHRWSDSMFYPLSLLLKHTKSTQVLPSCNLWKDGNLISACSPEPELDCKSVQKQSETMYASNITR